MTEHEMRAETNQIKAEMQEMRDRLANIRRTYEELDHIAKIIKGQVA